MRAPYDVFTVSAFPSIYKELQIIVPLFRHDIRLSLPPFTPILNTVRQLLYSLCDILLQVLYIENNFM
jgi:hypothetical protein